MSESFGDYCVGLNYVLLILCIVCFLLLFGVYDFIKCLSLIEVSVEGVQMFGEIVFEFVYGEGLQVYVRSVEFWMKG